MPQLKMLLALLLSFLCITDVIASPFRLPGLELPELNLPALHVPFLARAAAAITTSSTKATKTTTHTTTTTTTSSKHTTTTSTTHTTTTSSKPTTSIKPTTTTTSAKSSSTSSAPPQSTLDCSSNTGSVYTTPNGQIYDVHCHQYVDCGSSNEYCTNVTYASVYDVASCINACSTRDGCDEAIWSNGAGSVSFMCQIAHGECGIVRNATASDESSFGVTGYALMRGHTINQGGNPECI